jgi:DNA-binding transcriptional LysR family regulator
MDIEVLKTFLEVNRTRHFGKAANNLFVTQSTVSARIRLLESAVGAPVFLRTRNDIQLTAAGQRLLHYAENIFTTWNRARQEIAIEEEARYPLTFAGVPSLWDILLQEWLQTTYQLEPEIALYAEVLTQEVMTRRLREGTLDLAFMFDPPQMTELDIVEICEVPLIMVSSQPELGVAEAIQRDYILVDWGTLFAGAHAQHFPNMPPPALRIGLGRVAREFLLNRGGSAYLAEPMVKGYMEAGVLHRVEDAPVIRRPAYAAYPAESHKAELIRNSLAHFNPPS